MQIQQYFVYYVLPYLCRQLSKLYERYMDGVLPLLCKLLMFYSCLRSFTAYTSQVPLVTMAPKTVCSDCLAHLYVHSSVCPSTGPPVNLSFWKSRNLTRKINLWLKLTSLLVHVSEMLIVYFFSTNIRPSFA